MDPYRNEIKSLIEKLAQRKQSVFSLLCCERLLDNYKIFSLNFKWGDVSELAKGIDCLIRYIENNSFDKDEIKNIIKNISKITPNTEDFDTILVSFALDACNSVYESLNFLLNPNIEKVIDIASFARDTVDMYIQVKDSLDYSDPQFEYKIAKNFYMHQEKERQNKHLGILESNELDEHLINKLRTENKNKKIIDISLLPLDQLYPS